MAEHVQYDSGRVAIELRDQLASGKRRLAFLLGAGSSMSVGVPGIDALTSQVEARLDDTNKSLYQQIRNDLSGEPTVEDILDRVRLIKELLSGRAAKEYCGLTEENAQLIDIHICSSIKDVVCNDVSSTAIDPHKTLAQWLYASYGGRSWPVELFTTNYDLHLEQAMEAAGVPFYDGFIGSVCPFFVPESVDPDVHVTSGLCPPRTWTRLWKLHGSVNWYLLKREGQQSSYVTRLSAHTEIGDEQLMIFPSREKYEDSRRLPYLTYQDRLRRFLAAGESVLFVLGYSFSDDHINDIIFQGLRGNCRLAVNALMFGTEVENGGQKRLILPENMIEYGRHFRNLNVFGPDRAVIGGLEGKWSPPSTSTTDSSTFWSESEVRFTLGDFKAFAFFLERFIGFGSYGSAEGEGE